MSSLLQRTLSVISSASRVSNAASQQTYSDAYQAGSELSSVVTVRNNVPAAPSEKTLDATSLFDQSDQGTLKATNNCNRRISPSRDSGVGSASAESSEEPPEPPFQILDCAELERQCCNLLTQLQTATRLTADFRRDVINDRQYSSDLLEEMHFKIRPYLIRLDGEVAVLMDAVRKNLDRSKITEAKVNWLLHYNVFVLEFRKIVRTLICEVFAEFEKMLRLRRRGCVTIDLKQQLTAQQLLSIMSTLEELEKKKHFVSEDF